MLYAFLDPIIHSAIHAVAARLPEPESCWFERLVDPRRPPEGLSHEEAKAHQIAAFEAVVAEIRRHSAANRGYEAEWETICLVYEHLAFQLRDDPYAASRTREQVHSATCRLEARTAPN